MRLMALVFAAAIVLLAFGLLSYHRDRRLSRVLLGLGALLLLILGGGFFGLLGG